MLSWSKEFNYLWTAKADTPLSRVRDMSVDSLWSFSIVQMVLSFSILTTPPYSLSMKRGLAKTTWCVVW